MNPLRALVASVYVPSLFFSIGQGALQPVVVLAALKMGFSEAGASAVLGVFGLVGVISAPFLGTLIARRGDRPSLIFGGILGVGSLVLSLVSLFTPGSPWSKALFVVTLAILAISANIWNLGRQAYIADNVPPLWRARGLSTLGGMLRLGVLLGPLLATGLLVLWTVEAVFVLNLVTTAVSTILVVIYFAPPAATLATSGPPATTTIEIPEPPVPLPNWRATAIIGAGVSTLMLMRANKNVIIPLWGAAIGLPEHVITAAFTLSALIDSIMFYPAGKLTDRRGRLWSLLPALVIMSAAITLMVTWSTTAGFFISAALMGFGNGFGSGINMTIGADLSPPRNRAPFLGIWGAIGNAGHAAGPYVASGATAAIGVGAALWATAAIGLLGAAWLAVLLPRTYRRLGMDVRGRYLEEEDS